MNGTADSYEYEALQWLSRCDALAPMDRARGEFVARAQVCATLAQTAALGELRGLIDDMRPV